MGATDCLTPLCSWSPYYTSWFFQLFFVLSFPWLVPLIWLLHVYAVFWQVVYFICDRVFFFFLFSPLSSFLFLKLCSLRFVICCWMFVLRVLAWYWEVKATGDPCALVGSFVCHFLKGWRGGFLVGGAGGGCGVCRVGWVNWRAGFNNGDWQELNFFKVLVLEQGFLR